MAYVDYFGMDVVPDPIPAVHQVSMTAHIEPGAFIAVQIQTPTNTRRLGQYPPFMAAYYRVTTPLVGGLPAPLLCHQVVWLMHSDLLLTHRPWQGCCPKE